MLQCMHAYLDCDILHLHIYDLHAKDFTWYVLDALQDIDLTQW